MEYVNFTVNKDGNTDIFKVNINTTIESLKDIIKEKYNITKYIDIEFQIEKPMRVLGKFNVEPGVLPRTFDRYELNKFGINKSDIKISYNEIEDYTPFRSNKKEINLSKYNVLKKEDENESSYNIESLSEFPKLS
jgi:hypothetical protein